MKRQSSASTPDRLVVRPFVKPPTGLVSQASHGERKFLQAFNDWQREMFAMAAKQDAKKQMLSWNSSPATASHRPTARSVSLPAAGQEGFRIAAFSPAEPTHAPASISKITPTEAMRESQEKDADLIDQAQLTRKQQNDKVLRMRKLILF